MTMTTCYFDHALVEIEAIASLQSLIEKYGRHSTRLELEGRLDAAAACDIACQELRTVIDAVREAEALLGLD